MSQRLFLIDTCSFILQFQDPAYGAIFDRLILRGQFLLSAIVAMELYAGTKDKGTKQSLDRLSLELGRAGLLAIPDFQDYQRAGILLRNYSSRKGEIESTPHFRDLLIGLGAVRRGATVITENLSDFLRWKKEIDRSFHRPLEVESARSLLQIGQTERA